MELVVKVFKALANQKRLNILRLLMREGELPVSVIAKRLRISFTSASKNLLKLENVGLIKRREDSIWIYYEINRDRTYLYRELLFKFAKK